MNKHLKYLLIGFIAVPLIPLILIYILGNVINDIIKLERPNHSNMMYDYTKQLIEDIGSEYLGRDWYKEELKLLKKIRKGK